MLRSPTKSYKELFKLNKNTCLRVCSMNWRVVCITIISVKHKLNGRNVNIETYITFTSLIRKEPTRMFGLKTCFSHRNNYSLPSACSSINRGHKVIIIHCPKKPKDFFFHLTFFFWRTGFLMNDDSENQRKIILYFKIL